MPSTLFSAISVLVLASASLAQAAKPAPAQLPKPPGLKVVIETPSSALYSTPEPVGAVRSKALDCFFKAGWQPYGGAGDTRYFKQGKVRALLTVTVEQAPNGKTMLEYMSEAMNADLPLPPGVTEIQYSDNPPRLGFTSALSTDDTAAAYGKALAHAGWTTKMANPEKSDFDYVMIFRHPTEGMIRLDMRPGEGTLRASAIYQTQAEVEQEEAKAAAQGKAIKAKLAAAAAAPQPQFTLSYPKGATNQIPGKAGVSFTLNSGNALAGVKKIQSELEAQGWKVEQAAPLVPETGLLTLTKGDLHLSITYMDIGAVPAEITINTPKVVLKVQR